MQRLCHDDAVERPIGDLRGVGEVADDRGRRIAAVDVKHVSPGRTIAAVAARVFVVSDLERPAGDVSPVGLEEALDVVTVDGRPRSYATSRLTGRSRRRSPQSHWLVWGAFILPASGTRLRPHEDDEAVAKKLPAVRRGCEHSIGTLPARSPVQRRRPRPQDRPHPRRPLPPPHDRRRQAPHLGTVHHPRLSC